MERFFFPDFQGAAVIVLLVLTVAFWSFWHLSYLFGYLKQYEDKE